MARSRNPGGRGNPWQRMLMLLALAVLALGGGIPATAQQVQHVDPDLVIDGDLAAGGNAPTPQVATELPPTQSSPATSGSWPTEPVKPVGPTTPEAQAAQAAGASVAGPAQASTTYQKDDLVGAAEGVFGKGAEGLAGMIEDILKKQGEPNGYIVGREGGGALVFGVRYGSGTLFHKVEGQQPVYWTGPSLGLDAGANAGSTFILVYNLFDTADLFHRFGAGEGQAYLVGGFNVSYLRRGDVVLIPVRMGAGLRLGVNVGYMKFSRKQKWLPF